MPETARFAVDEQLLGRLAKRQLWFYARRISSNDDPKDAIDRDPRVNRGEFVIVASLLPREEGTIEVNNVEIRSTGPADGTGLGFDKPEFGDLLRLEWGVLHPLDPTITMRLWREMFTLNRELPQFVARHIEDSLPPALARFLKDSKGLIQRSHADAVVRAVEISNLHARSLTPLILFASFLRHRERGDELEFVLEWLVAARGLDSNRDANILEVLKLGDLMTLYPPLLDELSISREQMQIVNRLLDRARNIVSLTEPGETVEIRTRHLAAAFLTDNESIVPNLTKIGVDAARLRLDLFVWILKNFPGSVAARWRKALNLAAEEKISQSAQPAEPKPREFSIDTIVSRDTWTIDDSLGYGLYAQAITASILNKTTEPPLTIGIQAPWGQGKTSLMRMMQEELDPGAPLRDRLPPPLSDVRTAIQTTYARLLAWSWMKSAPAAPDEGMLKETRDAPSDTRPRIPTIWFNPLYYRETQQVWAGMAHAILQQLGDRFENPLEREKFWFRLQQSRVNVAAIRRDIHQWVLMRLVPIGFLLLAVALSGRRRRGEEASRRGGDADRRRRRDGASGHAAGGAEGDAAERGVDQSRRSDEDERQRGDEGDRAHRRAGPRSQSADDRSLLRTRARAAQHPDLDRTREGSADRSHDRAARRTSAHELAAVRSVAAQRAGDSDGRRRVEIDRRPGRASRAHVGTEEVAAGDGDAHAARDRAAVPHRSLALSLPAQGRHRPARPEGHVRSADVLADLNLERMRGQPCHPERERGTRAGGWLDDGATLPPGPSLTLGMTRLGYLRFQCCMSTSALPPAVAATRRSSPASDPSGSRAEGCPSR
ncbi:MAG TPA: P-loop NTPase fold protein, partial [Thermoanaerobaculia bacterium]|nr:P-loop NTPase fold protein [Thermoanaerobaculia bacterium]